MLKLCGCRCRALRLQVHAQAGASITSDSWADSQGGGYNGNARGAALQLASEPMSLRDAYAVRPGCSVVQLVRACLLRRFTVFLLQASTLSFGRTRKLSALWWPVTAVGASGVTLLLMRLTCPPWQPRPALQRTFSCRPSHRVQGPHAMGLLGASSNGDEG